MLLDAYEALQRPGHALTPEQFVVVVQWVKFGVDIGSEQLALVERLKREVKGMGLDSGQEEILIWMLNQSLQEQDKSGRSNIIDRVRKELKSSRPVLQSGDGFRFPGDEAVEYDRPDRWGSLAERLKEVTGDS